MAGRRANVTEPFWSLLFAFCRDSSILESICMQCYVALRLPKTNGQLTAVLSSSIYQKVKRSFLANKNLVRLEYSEMTKPFAQTAPIEDRGRQAKALEAYEAQRAVWDRVQNNLAKKLNRPDPSETLPGTVFHHRRRNEELGILDAAVPASMRNGSNAWEMSLRGGAGGVRFVQIGKAYPYPLYCPIRDSDCVPSDSNTFMRVIPMDKVPPRNKPAAESEYFHDRQAQFRKFVQKKFSHFHENQESMLIEGSAPPQSQDPIHEDNDIDPVVFIPTEPRSAAPPANGHPVTQFLTEEPKSRPLSAVTAAGSVQSQQPSSLPQGGPMLSFSSSHVTFSTAPGESSQGSIVVDNVGTTAVYYSWAVVPQVPIMEDMKQPDYFHLSDASSGVLLPEDQKMFTFTVRAPLPGIYTKQYELLTVPAGKERIIVQLRAVVISNEVNYVATSSLEAELHKKAMRDYQRHILTEPIWNPDNLVLDHANIDIEIRDLSKAKAKKLAELQGVGEFQEGNWCDRNAPLKLPYNQAVYSKLLILHRNFHTFLSTVSNMAPHSSVAAGAAGCITPADTPAANHLNPPQHHTQTSVGSSSTVPSPPAADWDGSVKSLIEDIALLKDSASRNMFMKALQALLACAEVSEDRSDSLHVLLSRSCGRKAWGHAMEELVKYVPVAKDLAEGKSVKAKTEKVETGKGSKPPPKAAAKPPPKGSAAAVSPDTKTGDAAGDVKHPNFDKFFHAGVRRIIGDAVESMFGRKDDTLEVIAAVTDRPFEYAVRRRIDAIAATQAAPDPELEVVQDTKQKKK